MSDHPFAVVTGAAVRLGRAIALRLAQEGYAIGVHYHHSRDSAEEVANLIRGQGGEAVLLPADLTQPADVEKIFSQVKELPNPFTVLVNSAAVMQKSDLRTLTVEEWDASFSLNLRAPWLCGRAALDCFSEEGVIINITDAGAGRAWRGYPAYILTKSALESLTRLMAVSYAPHVRVNAVAPGLILPAEDMPKEDWDRLVARLPLEEAGTPQQVADAVMFLIQNRHVTGQTLVVDGGYQLRS